DDAVPGIDRNREQRALLPLEDMALAVGVEPYLGGAAALHHQVDFLVQMLFGIESAGPRHLADVAAPFAFGAVQLDVCALAARPRPRGERQVLRLAHADIAEDGDAFRLHEQVVGRLRPTELAEAGTVDAGRLVPMRPAGQFMHDACSKSAENGNRTNGLLP